MLYVVVYVLLTDHLSSCTQVSKARLQQAGWRGNQSWLYTARIWKVSFFPDGMHVFFIFSICNWGKTIDTVSESTKSLHSHYRRFRKRMTEEMGI